MIGCAPKPWSCIGVQQTESKLTELQSKRNDQSSIMLSPEQEAS